ncbi:hypothetical protein [Salinivibrio costicola]|uniref:hypothetical protein n=1 Tax=Salinivibrio costicola TaxID=51367 RepID=UPI00039553D0|nr:hypothetical protein [Salinivibrio costicola]
MDKEQAGLAQQLVLDSVEAEGQLRKVNWYDKFDVTGLPLIERCFLLSGCLLLSNGCEQ